MRRGQPPPRRLPPARGKDRRKGEDMKTILPLCFAAFLLAAIGGAQAATVRIEQAVTAEDGIKVYTAFAWDDGLNVEPVAKAELGTFLDGVPASLTSLEPFAKTGEGMGVTVLLDISKSMAIRQGGTLTPFAQLVEATKKLIDAASPKDSFCVMTFGDDVRVVQPFTSDKGLLAAALSSLAPTAQNTLLYEGLEKALELNRQKGAAIPDRRAFIVISDGKDEGSGVTLDDVLRRDQLPAIPIFTVGYTRVEPEHLTALRRLSVMTGGLFFASPKPQEIDQTLRRIRQHFNQSYVIGLQPPRLDAAKTMTLKVVFTRDGTTSEGTKDIVVPASPALPEPAGFFTRHRWWLLGGAVGCLGLGLAGFLFYRRRARADRAGASDTFDSVSIPGFDGPGAAMRQDPTAPSGNAFSGADPEMPARVCGRLVVVESGFPEVSPGMAYEVYERTQIGRADDSTVMLPDPYVSRHHCDIACSRGVYALSDFRSENGTFLNGEPVEAETRLRHGDIITVGRVRLQFSEAV